MKLGILSLAFLTLLLQGAYPQQSQTGDITASLASCRIVQSVLNARERHREDGEIPEHDEFTAAGQGCIRLKEAVSSSQHEKIEHAAKALRPLLAQLGLPPSSPSEQFAAAEAKAAGLTGRELFYRLSDLAKRALNVGELERAQTYSHKLLSMAQQYRKDWNYGNAIFYGNLILGRVAVRKGDLQAADTYLLNAGSTPGSPQLDSFGPNMALAKELLQNDHTDVVLQYFNLCKKFWESGQDNLSEWSNEVKAGKLPDFGANLNY